VRTIGWTIGLLYCSQSSASVSALPVSRLVDGAERREVALLRLGQSGIGGAHVGDAGGAAAGRDLDSVQHRRQGRALPVGVVGVPALGRGLAVAMPDQPDIRIARHVVLRIMLSHRRAECLGGGEVLVGGQALIVKHQRQMLGERPRQRLLGGGIDRLRQIDPADFGADCLGQRRDRDLGHGISPLGSLVLA
jgi:hypothetical protein